MYKVILAHPGQQHSFKVATALKHQGVLYKYFTGIYDKPDSYIMKFVHFIAKGNDVNKAKNRRCQDLEDSDVITYYTFLSLCVIILSRHAKTKRISYWLDRKITDSFGIKIAKYAVKHNVDAVICFSMNETKCFEYLKKHAPNIKRIVDCANSPVAFMRHIYDADIKKTKYNILKKEVPSFWNSKEQEKQTKGINYTQYFLAPSTFVKKGLEFCGVSSENIKVLHYGCNFTPVDTPQCSIPSKIKFVYVGQVTYRKGMHYLLSVFSQIKRDDITLDVVGGWKPNSDLYAKYKDCTNIKFHGNVPHDSVKQILIKSNVFLFNSLTEGFSLSCLEALSCALPLVCSNNSGANDIIKDGFNGFTFDYEDKQKLSDIIIKLANNKELLINLSRNALETSKRNTWSLYEDNLKNVLSEILK